jgi:heat-inducible transcriptional repressor
VVLVLAILSNGRVEKSVLHVGRDVDDTTIATAGALLDTQLSGTRWNALPDLTPVAGPAADSLAREARDALVARADQEPVEPLYVGGASRLAAEHEAFPTTDSAARLLELLERQVEVVSFVHDLLDHGDTTVRIGSENSIDELRDCSIVVAPYKVDGEVAGTVGVLGPTRMDYRQALAAVEAISQQLGDVLS